MKAISKDMGMELDGEVNGSEVGASLEDEWEGEAVAMKASVKHGGVELESV